MQQLGLPAINTNMQKKKKKKETDVSSEPNKSNNPHNVDENGQAQTFTERCNYVWPHFKQADAVYLTCRRRQQQTANTKNHLHRLAGLARITAIPSLHCDDFVQKHCTNK